MLSPHVQFDPSVPVFTWDKEAFERGLDTENRAKTDAAYGEPPADAVDCQFLGDVRVVTRQVAQAGLTELENHCKVMMDTAEPSPNPDAEMRNERDRALADMYHDCQSGLDSADRLKTRVQEVRREFRDFTVHHGLVGKAAKERDRWAVWVILGCAGLELILNAWTLGTAHPSGIVGVVSEMALFTVFNVVAGLTIAASWRRKNHHAKFRGKRVSGWIFAAIVGAAVLFFNFVFGHYRDALVTLQSRIAEGDYETFVEAWANLFRTALATATSDEWIPRSMQTVVLIFGGMFMAVIAAYKQYRADDPYPGFGDLSRKRDKAEQQYAEKSALIRSQIRTRAEEAMKEIGVGSGKGVGDEAVRKIESWKAAYRNLVVALNEAGREQLRMYRRTSGDIKSWPTALNDSFDRFELEPDISDPPPGPEPPDDRSGEDVSQLRSHCTEVVLEGQARYSEVFPPLSALDSSDEDDAGKLDKIRQYLEGLRT